MSDLRSRLERLGNRVTPRADAFERLERTRAQRERNRRITAAVVALALAAAGTLTAFTLVRGEGPTLGDVGPASMVGVWPESTYEDALTTQEAVEAGEPSLQWRLDATETALAFARDALGWGDARVESAGIAPERASVLLRTPAAPCPSPPVPACLPREVVVELEQPFGPKKIWTVVSASSEKFTGLVPPNEIVAGDDVEIGSALEPGTKVYLAYVGLGACAGWEHDVVVDGGGGIETPTPTLEDLPDADGCDVALIVLYNDVSDHQTQGLGRQLLEYGYRTNLYGVLAVPIRLLPAPSGTEDVPDVVNVRCDGSSMATDTDVVRARPDGVHIAIVASETSFSIVEDTGQAEDPDAPAGSGQGFDTQNGEDLIIAQTPPGLYHLICASDQSEPPGTTSLEIVDPAGYYVPAELECPSGEVTGMAPSSGDRTEAGRGDPVDVVRARLTGLEEGDVVERAGYRESDGEAVVRVLREGRVVAVVRLFAFGTDEWLLDSLENCGEHRFGWGDEAVSPSPDADDAVVDCETGNVLTLSEVPLELTLVVEDLEFDLDCVQVPAGEPFTIHLENLDAGINHNVSIYRDGSDQAEFVGDVCLGPGGFTYLIPPLEAGTYRIVDDVHPRSTEVALLVE